MKPGQVVSIRVSPKDCMSVVDAIKGNGFYTPGMSYPAMVSMILAASLESMRKQGLIPTRDGFEYTEIMGPYIGKGRNLRAHNITSALMSNSDFQIRPVKGETNPFMAVQPVEPAQESSAPYMPTPKFNATLAEESGMTVREAQVELTELCAKKDLAEDGQYSWSSHNEERYQLCYKIVYPEG